MNDLLHFLERLSQQAAGHEVTLPEELLKAIILQLKSDKEYIANLRGVYAGLIPITTKNEDADHG